MFDEATWAAVAKQVQQCALRCVQNADDAQDLAQESVQAALRQREFHSYKDLLHFCLGTLRRQVAAYYRRRHYWRMIPLADTGEPVSKEDPGSELASRDAVQRAARLAAHLGAEERILLALLLEGCPRAQLAEQLGLTRAALRQRYRRLVLKLRRVDRHDPNRLRGVA